MSGPGVVASQVLVTLGGVEEEEELDLIPIAFADFVNGIYSYESASLTAADVVSDTGRISGLGLSIEKNDPVNVLNDFLDLIKTASFTMRINFTAITIASGVNVELLYALDSLGSVDQIYLTHATGYGELYDEAEENTAGGFENEFRDIFDDPDPTVVVGANSIALTRTTNVVAFSINGTVPAQADNTELSVDLNLDEVQIGSHFGSGPTLAGYIQSIEIFEPQSAAVLPTLSS